MSSRKLRKIIIFGYGTRFGPFRSREGSDLKLLGRSDPIPTEIVTDHTAFLRIVSCL
jgi:hypothetical protein